MVRYIGTKVDRITLDAVMLLRDEQSYYVSPFVPDVLYENAPTYIYHASIHAPDSHVFVCRIAIVFDSSPKFLAMPGSGISNKSSAKAFYVNRQGIIISSTNPKRTVGQKLDIDKALLTLDNGKSKSCIVINYGH